MLHKQNPQLVGTIRHLPWASQMLKGARERQSHPESFKVWTEGRNTERQRLADVELRNAET